MSTRFLDTVVARTRERVASAKRNGYQLKLRDRAAAMRRETRAFANALSRPDQINIIAEIKRASPSKGVISANVDAATTARRYQAGGAAAISVLTEPDYFEGSIADLLAATKTVDIPVLRKDFIVDEYQLIEAAAAGASAILLIAAALEKSELLDLREQAEEMGLDCLVEVHDAAELETATATGASIIGVNNRDLNTLEVTLDTSRRLAGSKPNGCIFVAESGIKTRGEIEELRSLGYDAFLLGEALMRDSNILAALTGP